MAPQTTVADAMTVGFAGAVADSGLNKNVRSYVNEEAADEIAFGLMVRQGTADNDALKLSTGDVAKDFLGVVVHSHAYDKPNELGDVGLKPDITMGVMTKGVIWVPVEEAVTPASDVLCRIIATGNEQAGAFRDTADASDTIDCSAFARFLTSTTGAGIAQLSFDMDMRG